MSDALGTISDFAGELARAKDSATAPDELGRMVLLYYTQPEKVFDRRDYYPKYSPYGQRRQILEAIAQNPNTYREALAILSNHVPDLVQRNPVTILLWLEEPGWVMDRFSEVFILNLKRQLQHEERKRG